MYSARAPSWLIDHGSPYRSMTPWTPAVKRVASSIIPTKASSVRTCSSVARVAATDRALPASVPPTPPVSMRSMPSWASDPVRELVAHAVRTRRDARRDRLPDRDDVRLEAPGQGAAARPGREGVGLVVDQERAVAPGQLADPLEVARVRQHDPDVGERRLHEHGRHVAVGQLALEPLEVVVLGDPRGDPHVDRCTDVALARLRAVRTDDDEDLVDRAVVAPGVDQDLGSLGDLPDEPDRPPVRVGRGEGERPQREPETAGRAPRPPTPRPRWASSPSRRPCRPAGAGSRQPSRRVSARPSRRCRPGRSRRTPGRRCRSRARPWPRRGRAGNRPPPCSSRSSGRHRTGAPALPGRPRPTVGAGRRRSPARGRAAPRAAAGR